jgi:hypothetical protein
MHFPAPRPLRWCWSDGLVSSLEAVKGRLAVVGPQCTPIDARTASHADHRVGLIAWAGHAHRPPAGFP